MQGKTIDFKDFDIIHTTLNRMILENDNRLALLKREPEQPELFKVVVQIKETGLTWAARHVGFEQLIAVAQWLGCDGSLEWLESYEVVG